METRSQRRSRKARSSSLFASVVKLLVENGLLNVSHVGMLALTCQEVNRACMEDDVWESLCLQKWPDLASFPEDDQRRGYRRMYWERSVPVAKRGPPTVRLRPPSIPEHAAKRRPLANDLGPPSCSPDQVQLRFNFKYEGSTGGSKVFTGHELGGLLEDGFIKIRVNPPISVGKAHWTYSDNDRTSYENDEGRDRKGLSVGCSGFNPDDVCMYLHLFRTTDSNTCCLVDSDREEPVYEPMYAHPVREEGERVSRLAEFDLSREQVGGWIAFGATSIQQFKGLTLGHSIAATEIANRTGSVEFTCSVKVEVDHDENVAMTQIVIVAFRSPKGGEQTLHAFNSSEEEREHGVTLLHILSELQ